MGGIGKTTLAGVVARISEVEQYFSDGVFWVDLQATDAMAALDHVACAYGHDVSSHSTLESRAKAVRSILSNKKVLIVLDNAWQIEETSWLLPYNLASCALITTRDEDLAYDINGEVIPVTVLTETEGVELLAKLIGGVAREPSNACLEITRLLGHLPLALELAGKRIRKAARNAWFSWSDILDSLRGERNRLDLGSKDQTVRATFNISYARGLDESGRTLFNWLGLLLPNDLELGAIARVADIEEHAAKEILDNLTDLSLIQQISVNEYRLHPLLYDFACEKFAELGESLRLAGYRRACDYFYERAQQECKNPKSLEDIRPVLNSHHYAWKAHGKEQARRVFPWFGSVAVPGFLIDQGYPRTLVYHSEIDLGFAKEDGDFPEAYAEYWLGDAVASAGDLTSASEHLKRAIAIIDQSDASEAGKDMAQSRFSFRLGQVCASIGDFDGAIAAYQTSWGIDHRKGLTSQELTTMLQIGDLYIQKGAATDTDIQEASRIFEEVRNLARQEVHLAEEAMALTRLAELAMQIRPEHAVQYLQEAIELDKGAFSGRQGIRYATRLGRIASNLLFNSQSTLPLALTAFSIAIKNSGEAGSRYEQSLAFYWLGHLFEHLFLIPDRDADYVGAIACYVMAEKLAEGMELPPAINPQERIETRIRTQLDAVEFNTVVENAIKNAEIIIQSAIQRLS
jgi:tetratricopeptide (TPR) repeat protein